MPETNGNETLAVFIQLVSKSIEQTASLKTSVDNVVKVQERQEGKLDLLSTTLTRIETMNSGLLQRIGTAEERVGDHEARLRLMEPYKGIVDDNIREIEKITKSQSDINTEVAEIKKELIKYGAYAAIALFAIQFGVSAFIVPWVQNVWFK